MGPTTRYLSRYQTQAFLPFAHLPDPAQPPLQVSPLRSNHPSPRCKCGPCCHNRLLLSLIPLIQGLNNAVALDFDYREQMIYWTDVTTQGSMIRRMHLNGSNVQVRQAALSDRHWPTLDGCFQIVSPSRPTNPNCFLLTPLVTV